MKKIIFFFLLSTNLFANTQIIDLLAMADQTNDFSDDLDQRINYEIEKWKAPKVTQRHFWREIVMQTHYHPYLKYDALKNWAYLSQDIGHSLKDCEDLSVYVYNEFMQALQEKDPVRLEHWSSMIHLLQNNFSNMEDLKKKNELFKILKIRIDPKNIHRFI
jgi:hypothetical protein